MGRGITTVAPHIEVNLVTDFGAIGDGSGDDAALLRFRTWARMVGTTQIILNIPTGDYKATTPDGFRWLRGIKKIELRGVGPTTILRDHSFFAASEIFDLGTDGSARIQTCSAGAGTVTLITGADHEKFSAGTYVIVCGLDLQGAGAPPNWYFWEFNQITSIDAGTGVITLVNPLENDYLSTWPLYFAGSGFDGDKGGPASIFRLNSWDSECVVRDLAVRTSGGAYQVQCQGKLTEFINCTFDSDVTPIPSVSQRCLISDTDCPSTGPLEMDKLVQYVEYRNCAMLGIDFQSASVERAVLNNVTMSSSLNGTPKYAEINNCSILGGMLLGPLYGRTVDCIIRNTVFGGAIDPRIDEGTETVITGGITFSGGTFTIADTEGVMSWAVPENSLFVGSAEPTNGAFQITGMTQSGSDVFIATTLPDITGISTIRNMPSQTLTCTDCSGTDQAVWLSRAAAAGKKLWEYYNKTYGPTIPSATTFIGQRGELVEIRINVTQAYIGPATGIVGALGPGGIDVYARDANDAYVFNPKINIKIAGERVITPSSTTGLQSGDVMEFTDGQTDFSNGCWISSVISALHGNFGDYVTGATQTALVEVTVITDQDDLN